MKSNTQIILKDLLSTSTENRLFHRLASKAIIQEKQDTDLDDEKVKEDIITMSKSLSVISKLTSFVAVDQESRKPVSRPMKKPESMMYETMCGSSLPAYGMPMAGSAKSLKGASNFKSISKTFWRWNG